MSIRYAGGVNINAQIAADTKTLITDNLKIQLVLAGWTVAAGASGDWKLDSVATPSGHRCRVRIKNEVSDNCGITLSNVAETLNPAQIIWLVPGVGKLLRVIANRYQFIVFEDGAVTFRDFAFCSNFYTPAFLAPVNNCFLGGNGQSTGDVTTRSMLRNGLAIHSTAKAWIYNLSVFSAAAGSASIGSFRIQHKHDPLNSANVAYRWADDSLQVYDALAAHGMTIDTAEAKIIGQLWDALICSGDFVDGAVITYDGKQFWPIGVSLTGATRGTLFLYAP